MKSKTELLGDQITKWLYEEEAKGLEMNHFSELGWRLATKVKHYLNEDEKTNIVKGVAWYQGDLIAFLTNSIIVLPNKLLIGLRKI